MIDARAFLLVAIGACFVSLGSAGGADQSATATPAATASPSPGPSTSDVPSPLPTPTDSATPYVRRYFNGRPIDTPQPTIGPDETATPYVRRYFQGRPIDTPLPAVTATPLPGATPYVKRYYNGRPIVPPDPYATATPLRVPTEPPIPEATRTDRVEALVGEWHCTTFGGTDLTHDYSRGDGNVALVVTTNVKLPSGKSAQLHETYERHAKAGSWSASLSNARVLVQARDWNGDSWTFVGNSTETPTPTRVRMVYRMLGDDVFRRDFERANGSGWETYAGETCRRAAASD